MALRGQAWVVFADVESATNALRQMQGFLFFNKNMVRGALLPLFFLFRVMRGRGAWARACQSHGQWHEAIARESLTLCRDALCERAHISVTVLCWRLLLTLRVCGGVRA